MNADNSHRKLNINNKLMICLVFNLYIGCSLVPLPCHADALEPLPEHEKLVRVRPTLTNPNQSGLQIEFKSEQASYQPDQPIRFQIKGNQRFFLYLFTISPDTVEAVSLLPNRIQTNAQIQYDPGYQWQTVPNSKLEFFSDRSGYERIIMVASSRYLDVDQMKQRAHTKSTGDFYTLKHPLAALEAIINDTYRDKIGSEKLIRIREPDNNHPRLPEGVVIKEMQLRIN